jgi:predicted transcriptional regulator
MNLQKQIAKRGLKKVWIAKQVGIHPVHLSRIIHGDRNPSKRTLRKILDVISGRIPLQN